MGFCGGAGADDRVGRKGKARRRGESGPEGDGYRELSFVCQCLRPFGGLRGTPGGMRALFGWTGIDGTLIPGTLRYRIWCVIGCEGAWTLVNPVFLCRDRGFAGQISAGPLVAMTNTAR